MKKLITILLTLAALALCVSPSFAQEKKAKKKKADSTAAMPAAASSETSPKTVIHVITVNFKSDATPDQVKAAIDGAHKLPAAYPGILHVWSKIIKNQTEMSHLIIMEFASEQALKDYAGSDAQKEWYKLYEGIRDHSTTFDVTN